MKIALGADHGGFPVKTALHRLLTRLGQALPPAIMAVLVIYCLREGFEKPLSAGIPLLAGTALVFFSYRWKHNTLLSIALGTAGYMLALRLLFLP